MDIYKQIRMTTGMVANVWGWTSATTTLFRQVMPGLARVRVGSETFTCQGFLLQDLETISAGSLGPNASTCSANTYLSHTAITDTTIQEVTIRHATPYFGQVLL